MSGHVAEAPTGLRTEPLYVDLVPSTAWCANLRSVLTAAEWRLVKSKTFESSGHFCQACGGRGKRHPVECHERWSYDMATRVQSFVKTVALCPSCHRAPHIGFASTASSGSGRFHQEARADGALAPSGGAGRHGAAQLGPPGTRGEARPVSSCVLG